MKIEMIDVEPCVKKLVFEVPVERVDEEKEVAYRELSKSVTIPGFRKGHVPKRLLEQKYHKNVMGDVARKLIEEAYREGLEKNSLKPAGEPTVDDVNLEEKKPLTFTATVEIFPNIELVDFSGWTLTRKIKTVPDKEMDDILKHYQQEQSWFEPVVRDVVEEGDYPIIDYSASKEDGTLVEHFAGRNKQIEISSEGMLGDFQAGIIGMKKGEEKEFDVKLPKEFPIADMSDTMIRFKVKVHEIKKKVTPEINNELVKTISKFETVDEFKADLRKQLEKRNREMAENDLYESLIDKLIEENKFDLPKKTVERQAMMISNREEHKLKIQGFKPGEEGRDPEKIHDKHRKSAERILREEVILATFAKDKNLEVTKEDIDRQVASMAKSMKQSVEKVYELIKESGQGLDGLTHHAFREKALNAILENITIEDENIEDLNAK